MQPKTPVLPAKKWKFERNPSWFASVKLALYHGVWMAPTNFAATMLLPGYMLLGSIGTFLACLVTWVVATIGLLVTGLLGRITEIPPIAQQAEVDDFLKSVKAAAPEFETKMPDKIALILILLRARMDCVRRAQALITDTESGAAPYYDVMLSELTIVESIVEKIQKGPEA